jgi:hypothetical protein
LEEIVLSIVLIGAGLIIVRHLKNVMINGEQDKSCGHCALNQLKKPPQKNSKAETWRKD